MQIARVHEKLRTVAGRKFQHPLRQHGQAQVVVKDMHLRVRFAGSEDLDASHTYAFNTVNGTTSGTLKDLNDDDITFTSGADMDSLAAGDLFIFRVERLATSGSDTMSGDAMLLAVVGKET